MTKDFWKQDQISEQQFIEKADTFDILLFKTSNAGGKIIRAYTGSEFGKWCYIANKSTRSCSLGSEI